MLICDSSRLSSVVLVDTCDKRGTLQVQLEQMEQAPFVEGPDGLHIPHEI